MLNGNSAWFDASQAAGAALAVMLVCTALGSAAGGGKGRLPGADTLVGMGLAAACWPCWRL